MNFWEKKNHLDASILGFTAESCSTRDVNLLPPNNHFLLHLSMMPFQESSPSAVQLWCKTMCSVICSATSACCLTYLTKLSSLKCKDNYFQKSLKKAGPLEDMGIRDLLDFQTVSISEKSPRRGISEILQELCVLHSGLVLENEKIYYLSGNPTRAGSMLFSSHSFQGIGELHGYPETEHKTCPAYGKVSCTSRSWCGQRAAPSPKRTKKSRL